MTEPTGRPLTEVDRERIFRKATAALARHYGATIETGMSDADLEAALKSVLGIFGGSGGPDQPSIAYSSSGLRIWGGWQSVNTVRDKPLFAGKQTIAMARLIYTIANPSDAQMRLL